MTKKTVFDWKREVWGYWCVVRGAKFSIRHGSLGVGLWKVIRNTQVVCGGYDLGYLLSFVEQRWG